MRELGTYMWFEDGELLICGRCVSFDGVGTYDIVDILGIHHRVRSGDFTSFGEYASYDAYVKDEKVFR